MSIVKDFQVWQDKHKDHEMCVSIIYSYEGYPKISIMAKSDACGDYDPFVILIKEVATQQIEYSCK